MNASDKRELYESFAHRNDLTIWEVLLLEESCQWVECDESLSDNMWRRIQKDEGWLHNDIYVPDATKKFLNDAESSIWEKNFVTRAGPDVATQVKEERDAIDARDVQADDVKNLRIFTKAGFATWLALQPVWGRDHSYYIDERIGDTYVFHSEVRFSLEDCWGTRTADGTPLVSESDIHEVHAWGVPWAILMPHGWRLIIPAY
jgi:hypothetical protein